MPNLVTFAIFARGLHLAASLSLLGATGFAALLLPTEADAPLQRRVARCCWISGLATLLAGAVWFVAETAAIAGASDLSQLWEALPVVAMKTRFGTVVMLRLGLLLIAICLAAAAGRRRGAMWMVLALGIVIVGLQGLTGHAGATGGVIGYCLVASEAVHLTAAGLWLGGLVPLWLTIRSVPPAAGALVCEQFSPIGLGCVLLITATGIAQAFELVGSLPALIGTDYGHVLLLKIGLFAFVLVLAAFNRLSLTDRLADGAPAARRTMLASIGIETLSGLAIVYVAGFLASCVPAAHSAPVWPLSWQFSLVTVDENADFRQEVIVSLLLIGGAAALLGAALLWGRMRLAGLLLLGTIIWLRGPSLGLLTVEAYPSSFQTSPTHFAAASIVRGQALFSQHCAECHGSDGRGNGPAAAGMRIRPVDLTLPHVLGHSDGEMFWWLSHGIDDPEGGLAMPGFGPVLTEVDRWALIDYVRAHNVGSMMREDPETVRAPVFSVACKDRDQRVSSTGDLRGRAVLLVSDTYLAKSLAIEDPVVVVGLRAGVEPPAVSCVSEDPAAWNAYAILAGVPPVELPGTEFLVDPNGWLRAVHWPNDGGGWHTSDELSAAIRHICASPIERSSGGHHDHH